MQDDCTLQDDLRCFEASNSPAGLFARYARGRIGTFWKRQLFCLAGSLAVALLIGPVVAIAALVIVVLGEALESAVLRHLLRRYPDGGRGPHVRRLQVAATLFQALGVVAAVWLLAWNLRDPSGNALLIAMMAGGVLNAGLAIGHAPRLATVRLVAYGAGAVAILVTEFLRAVPTSAIVSEMMAMLLTAQMLWLIIADLRRGFHRRVTSRREFLLKSIEAEDARRSLAAGEATSRRLALIARHANDSMFFADTDFRIVYVNETFERRTGYTAEEVLGRDPRELLTGRHSDRATLDRISAAIRGLRPIRTEMAVYGKHRHEVWVEVSISPNFDKEGQPSGFIGVSRDITQAKRREAELQRLSLVARHAKDGIFIADESGRIQYVNEAFVLMTGLRRQDLMGRAVSGLFADPDADPGLRERISASIREKRPVRSEILLIDRAGARKWVDCSITPLTDDQGQLSGHINVSRDISDAKSREAEISRLSLVARHASDGIVISGADGRIEWANPTFTARTGLELNEVVGRAPGELLLSLGGELEVMRSVAAAVAARQPLRTDFQYHSKSGEPILVETQMTPILGSDGSMSGYIAVERDVAEAKLREAELAEAKAVAEEALQAKTLFLATMSHEIRTPLNGVIGTADLLATTVLDPRQFEYVDTLVQSGEALLTIVNDILEMSRLEGGRLDLVEAPFDVAETVGAVVRLMRAGAEAKELRIDASVSPKVPSHLVGDAGRLRQILLNLTGNAIKFTERGQVTLSVTPAEDGMIEFAVADTGIGITPDRVEAVFESFTQENSNTSRHFGGTGLGLTISRMLARAMRGDIVARSTPGAGSTFTARLPLLAASSTGDAGQRPEVEATIRAGSKVLVAEDNKANRFLISRYLADLGIAITFAENGREAVEAFVADRPDVVLMDVSMPVMDGLAATREIRRIEQGPDRCPILGVTANAFEEDRRRCLEAGMTGFVAKPVRRTVLLGALAEALRDDPARSVAAE